MPEKTTSVPNISCHHCTSTIQRELLELDGVELVEADPATKRVRVRWQTPASWEEIAATLAEIGYPPGD
jgi:copper chaperone CopZ